MMRLSPEAKVGLFVLIGVAILVFMSLKVGGIKLGSGEGYDLLVKFDNVGGLDVDAPVRVAGVEIGRIRDIRLKDNKAEALLRINPGITIGKDFTAVIKTKGLLGEKYIELIPGSPEAPAIEPGEEITRTKTFAEVDVLITQLSAISKDLRGIVQTLGNVLGGDKGEKTIRNIVGNIEGVTKNLNRMIALNNDKFNRVMNNFEAFSSTMRTGSPEIIENLKKVTRNLNNILKDNRSNLRDSIANLKEASNRLEETLASIRNLTDSVGPRIDKTFSSIQHVADKVNKGEGTIGKLINEDDTVDNLNKTLTGVNNFISQNERFRFFLGFHNEYLFDSGNAKNFVSLRIQPREDKYYLLEMVDDPLNRVEFDKNGMKKPENKVRLNVQIAKRFYNVTLRAGLIESQGGVGIDYNPFNGRFKLSFEASDFDEKRNPYLKLAATYYVNKYFFVTGGYNDFISAQGLESPFLGMGLRFEDEDIKFILLNAPIPTN